MEDVPSTASSAFLLATHFMDAGIAELYREVVEDVPADVDVFVLLHEGPEPATSRGGSGRGAAAPPDLRVVPYSDEEVWDGLGLRDRDSPFRERRIFPGAVVLSTAWFRTQHPGYDAYWVCEYDVRFSGSWSVPLEHFASSSADLLTTTLCRRPVTPEWSKWEGLRSPGGEPAPESMVRGFLPFYRISPRGLDAAVSGYREGWKGHFECSLPTMLLAKGLTLEDLGGRGEFVEEGNRDRFYTNTPEDEGLAPGTFVFRPVRETSGERRDTLWHPVKTRGAPRWEEEAEPTWSERLRASSRRVRASLKRLAPWR